MKWIAPNAALHATFGEGGRCGRVTSEPHSGSQRLRSQNPYG